MVQNHLYNRPLPDHAMQNAKVLFRGNFKAPLFEDMNPEAAPLFDVTAAGRLTAEAVKKV